MKLFRYFGSLMLALMGCATVSADCDIAIGLAPFITEGDNVGPGVEKKLQTKLKTALAHSGVTAGEYNNQFFLIGRFDEDYSNEAGGAGGRVLVKTNLQLAICDGNNQKVFAIANFPLKGVGATNEQAITRALGSLNANNPEFINFVDNAKKKIIDYFDSNYQTYLQKAQSAMSQRNYDEALYWSSSIPECSRGYTQASTLMQKVISGRINYEGSQLLAKAEAEWAANPTDQGASAAYAYIQQIDPSSSSYAAAKALGQKMAASVKADYDFETKEKYRNAVELEKTRIKAARDAAVAWAKNQPKTIVRHHWIVWR
ncbi:MAG: hypothetical protein K2M59_09270 [Muribaculaceae bacterium]|nr:hypothetical protein [Muribaculaceae bacterium]